MQQKQPSISNAGLRKANYYFVCGDERPTEEEGVIKRLRPAPYIRTYRVYVVTRMHFPFNVSG